MALIPPTTRATTRFATCDDTEGMRAVYTPYVKTPITFDIAVPTPNQFAARMKNVMPAYPCLVLEQGERIVGFAYAHAQAQRAAYRWNAELSVYLDQGTTGNGWGSTLYDALLKLVHKQGILNAYGLVTIPNEASEHLHDAFGFERSWVQRHAGWKDGSWYDVAWYVKALAPVSDCPCNPMPFDECARIQESFVQQVLTDANAALVTPSWRA